MTALIINAGPVNGPGVSKPPGDIGAVAWPEGRDILTINGSGSSHFSGLVNKWNVGGHILPQLLAAYGRKASDYSSISLTGFSAGHGLFNPLLLLDGDAIDAAVLFDSCFTVPKGPASNPSPGKDGYAAFGARAIAGEKLLVLTASHGENGPGLPPSATGSECVRASFERALALTGASAEPFEPAGIPTTNPKGNFYAGPGALVTEHAGQFLVLDYGPLYYHGDHINLLSRDVLDAFLVPYLKTGVVPGIAPSGSPEGRDEGEMLLFGAAGVIAALALFVAWRRRQ